MGVPQCEDPENRPQWVAASQSPGNVRCRRAVTSDLSGNIYLSPSCTSWWALQMSSSPLMWLNSVVTREPWENGIVVEEGAGEGGGEGQAVKGEDMDWG